MDGTPELAKFATDLEEACVETIDVDGVMTKDLALAMKGKDMSRGDWVTTDVYMSKVHVSVEDTSTVNVVMPCHDPLSCHGVSKLTALPGQIGPEDEG